MTDETLLRQLLLKKPGLQSEWEAFLKRFSNLILKIIWEFEKDYDEVMEKYLYICGKLAENDFARLRRFQTLGDRSPRFTTWLAAVTHNLCIDAHRSRHGRKQLPRAILRLPEFDREVFRKYYWKGYTLEELRQSTGSSGGDALMFADSLRRIQEALAGTVLPSPPVTTVSLDENDPRLAVEGSDPDYEEMLDWLSQWMSALGSRDRLIIRLRFWEDLTGPEIARVMNISPEEKVYPLLQKAIGRLRDKAGETYGSEKPRGTSVSHEVKGQGKGAS